MCVLQDLTATLVSRAQAGPTEVVEELKARLALKEKLFQELLSDRSRQSNEHQAQVQDLLNTLSSKDQYLQVGQGAGLASSDENLTGRACTSVDDRHPPPSGLLPQDVTGDQRAEQPAAGAPQAAVITRSGAARAETGQGERDGRGDGASAQSPQREGIPDQGTCSWV